MGSSGTAQSGFPTIELKIDRLNNSSDSWISTAKEVISALELYGCFEAVCKKLDSHQEIVQCLEDLFNLPEEIKARTVSEDPFAGYEKSAVPPRPDSLCVHDATALGKLESFTNQIWPHGNPHFCKSIVSYVKLAAEVEAMIRKMVFESYGVKNYSESNKSIFHFLRTSKYGESNSNVKQTAIPIHTDRSFISILFQNQVNGLEIQSRDGNWIHATPSPCSFIVMVGEAFMAWSNGRLHSPPHRVMLSGSQARYMIGVFSFSKATVETPEELVDDEHPLKFKPFDHIGLIRFARTMAGGNTCQAVQAYCGL